MKEIGWLWQTPFCGTHEVHTIVCLGDLISSEHISSCCSAAGELLSKNTHPVISWFRLDTGTQPTVRNLVMVLRQPEPVETVTDLSISCPLEKKENGQDKSIARQECFQKCYIVNNIRVFLFPKGNSYWNTK